MEHIENIKKELMKWIDHYNEETQYHIEHDSVLLAAGSDERKKAIEFALEIIEREFDKETF